MLNYITNNSIWHTRVTWQGNKYEIPEDDTVLSKHVGGCDNLWINCGFVGHFTKKKTNKFELVTVETKET